MKNTHFGVKIRIRLSKLPVLDNVCIENFLQSINFTLLKILWDQDFLSRLDFIRRRIIYFADGMDDFADVLIRRTISFSQIP